MRYGQFSENLHFYVGGSENVGFAPAKIDVFPRREFDFNFLSFWEIISFLQFLQYSPRFVAKKRCFEILWVF